MSSYNNIVGRKTKDGYEFEIEGNWKIEEIELTFENFCKANSHIPLEKLKELWEDMINEIEGSKENDISIGFKEDLKDV